MEDIFRANAPHNSESRQNNSLRDIAHLHPLLSRRFSPYGQNHKAGNDRDLRASLLSVPLSWSVSETPNRHIAIAVCRKSSVLRSQTPPLSSSATGQLGSESSSR
jgi:hypothetical protein